MEPIFVVIIIALIAGAKWMMKQNSTDEDETSTPTVDDVQRQEERVRKFMEALGIPAPPKNSPPPRAARPLVRIRTEPKATLATQPRTVRPAPPKTPWAETGFPPIVHAPLPPPVVVYEEPVAPVPIPEPVNLPVEPLPAPAPPVIVLPAATPLAKRQTRVELMQLLREPTSLRAAIVTREILGAPLSLRPQGTDFVGSRG